MLMSLNWTLKMVKMVNFMLRVYYYNFKIFLKRWVIKTVFLIIHEEKFITSSKMDLAVICNI